MKRLEKRSFTRMNAFQDNIALGRPNQWRCRAGRALPLHLRGRPGALLLAAARISRRFRWRNTRSAICAANSTPRNPARRTAPSHACIRCRYWTPGAHRRIPRQRQSTASCRSSSFHSAVSYQPSRHFNSSLNRSDGICAPVRTLQATQITINRFVFLRTEN